jgi:hypothetical protein
MNIGKRRRTVYIEPIEEPAGPPLEEPSPIIEPAPAKPEPDAQPEPDPAR